MLVADTKVEAWVHAHARHVQEAVAALTPACFARDELARLCRIGVQAGLQPVRHSQRVGFESGRASFVPEVASEFERQDSGRVRDWVGLSDLIQCRPEGLVVVGQVVVEPNLELCRNTTSARIQWHGIQGASRSLVQRVFDVAELSRPGGGNQQLQPVDTGFGLEQLEADRLCECRLHVVLLGNSVEGRHSVLEVVQPPVPSWNDAVDLGCDRLRLCARNRGLYGLNEAPDLQEAVARLSFDSGTWLERMAVQRGWAALAALLVSVTQPAIPAAEVAQLAAKDVDRVLQGDALDQCRGGTMGHRVRCESGVVH